jgi:hypothetical protein
MLRYKGRVVFACLLTSALCTCSLWGQQASSGTLRIADGTPVRLSLMDALSSATNQVDDPVHFEVTEDVKVGDVVAIPRGSTASGHVVEVQPKRRLGRAGKLNFSVDYVKAPDGTNVRLRASSTRQGEEKSGTVIVGTLLLSPLFLIMRGKDVNIPKGTQFNAYVDGDREIALAPPAPAPAAAPAAAAAPVQTQAQPPPAQAAPASSVGEELTTAVLKSNPDGADITVDGRFVGSTPSSVRLRPGEHTILIQKSGFKSWQRTMFVNPGGIVTIDATLEKVE